MVYLACVLVAIALVASLFGKLRQVYIALREHERVQRHLQQTNRFLESLLENMPAMIFAKDAQDLRFVRFNRIVARHGGRIWAESEPGRGAAFHFTLPLVAARADTDTDERPGLFVSTDS